MHCNVLASTGGCPPATASNLAPSAPACVASGTAGQGVQGSHCCCVSAAGGQGGQASCVAAAAAGQAGHAGQAGASARLRHSVRAVMRTRHERLRARRSVVGGGGARRHSRSALARRAAVGCPAPRPAPSQPPYQCDTQQVHHDNPSPSSLAGASWPTGWP